MHSFDQKSVEDSVFPIKSQRVVPQLSEHWCRATIVLVASLLVAGCHSLPDVQPFADATSKLRHTVASSGKDAVDQASLLDTNKGGGGGETTNVGQTLGNKLAADWETRNKLMEALDNYASALTGVVQAGNEGAKSAKAVGDAASNLAASLNVAFPGGGTAAGTVTQLAGDIFAITAREWSAHVLVQRLSELDPKIQQVAHILAADLGNLNNIVWAEKNKALGSLAAGSDDLARVNTLVKRRRDAAAHLSTAPLDGSSTNLSDQLKVVREINEALDLETKTPGYSDYLRNVAAVQTMYENQSAVINQAVILLDAWAAAHHQMLLALKEKRPPSLQELTQLASDLQDVYKQIHTKAKP